MDRIGGIGQIGQIGQIGRIGARFGGGSAGFFGIASDRWASGPDPGEQ